MPGVPADKDRLAEYEAGPYKGYGKKIQEAFAAIAPEDADCWRGFAEAIVKVVDAPFGNRTFPVHIDPTRTEPRWPSQLLTASGWRCFIGFALMSCSRRLRGNQKRPRVGVALPVVTA